MIPCSIRTSPCRPTNRGEGTPSLDVRCRSLDPFCSSANHCGYALCRQVVERRRACVEHCSAARRQICDVLLVPRPLFLSSHCGRCCLHPCYVPAQAWLGSRDSRNASVLLVSLRTRNAFRGASGHGAFVPPSLAMPSSVFCLLLGGLWANFLHAQRVPFESLACATLTGCLCCSGAIVAPPAGGRAAKLHQSLQSRTRYALHGALCACFRAFSRIFGTL